MFDINHVAEHIQLIFHGCKLSMTDEHNVSAILKLSSYEDCRAKISPKMSTFKAKKNNTKETKKASPATIPWGCVLAFIFIGYVAGSATGGQVQPVYTRMRL